MAYTLLVLPTNVLMNEIQNESLSNVDVELEVFGRDFGPPIFSVYQLKQKAIAKRYDYLRLSVIKHALCALLDRRY